ncbi:electron transport complex subunit RsxB [Pigmentiphaga litoralis]|uniref:Electron transport complex protein RnfB n=1 Tax=Pigmentiphaga litoralis TaxID=516702 RepID=A0A7Y9IZ17_9BURK|nr:electron transport complex protein RnfB [Pigmentiphaga litoralis]NYE85642.1 electron transport complex protein RnfB [Pigmentiphaga litoralis]
MHDLADRIDARLPQTQCTKCGFDGCRPYAEAIANGTAGIDRCPPGGEAGVATLAALLDRPIVPLDLTRGLPGPLRVARIDEQHCIGCTLCIQACPVDAIVGANKRMHTILPSACTGCDLCVAPCPVDCIHMEVVAPPRAWTEQDAADARRRYTLRQSRLIRESDREHSAAPTVSATAGEDWVSRNPAAAQQDHEAVAVSVAHTPSSATAGSAPAIGQPDASSADITLPPLSSTPAPAAPADSAAERKQAILAAALARARARRAG